jgi:hypothetical protein
VTRLCADRDYKGGRQRTPRDPACLDAEMEADMSTTRQTRRAPDTYSGGAVTVTVMAGVLMMLVGVMHAIQGLVALVNDNFYVFGKEYVFEFDITAWGWIHIVLGAIGVAAGVGILMNQTWAQVTGIGFACLSALANFAFLPYYPLWAIVVIAFNVLVIWALAQQASTGGRRA